MCIPSVLENLKDKLFPSSTNVLISVSHKSSKLQKWKLTGLRREEVRKYDEMSRRYGVGNSGRNKTNLKSTEISLSLSLSFTAPSLDRFMEVIFETKIATVSLTS